MLVIKKKFVIYYSMILYLSLIVQKLLGNTNLFVVQKI